MMKFYTFDSLKEKLSKELNREYPMTSIDRSPDELMQKIHSNLASSRAHFEDGNLFFAFKDIATAMHLTDCIKFAVGCDDFLMHSLMDLFELQDATAHLQTQIEAQLSKYFDTKMEELILIDQLLKEFFPKSVERADTQNVPPKFFHQAQTAFNREKKPDFYYSV